MNSSNVVSYIDVPGAMRQPVYGCGLKKDSLKMYEMGKAKKMGLCLDWLNNRCIYAPEECRFAHELPPMKSDEIVFKIREQNRIAALPQWRQRKLRYQQRRAKALKPKATKTLRLASTPAVGGINWAERMKDRTPAPSTVEGYSMETQTATSIGGDMSMSGSRSDIPETENASEPWAEEYGKVDTTEVPVVHTAPAATPAKAPEPVLPTPTAYEPAPIVTNFESVRPSMLVEPQMLSLNAHAPEYSPLPPVAYAQSNSGSLVSEEPYTSMSTSQRSYTPAPSYHGSVSGEPLVYHAPPVAPPAPMTVPPMPMPAYAPVQYVHPNTIAAIQQQMSKELTAQVSSYKASQDKVLLHYKAELAKVQQETSLMTSMHQKAMQQVAYEQALRLKYQRELAELRKQKDEALMSANRREQQALETASRLEKELESRKNEEKALQQQAVSYLPQEEIVQPEDINTFFTTPAPVTSLVEPVPESASKVAETVKPAPAKPLSERKPKTTEAEVTLEERAQEAAVVEQPARVRTRRTRRKRAAIEPVVVETPAVPVEVAPEAPAVSVGVVPQAPDVQGPESSPDPFDEFMNSGEPDLPMVTQPAPQKAAPTPKKSWVLNVSSNAQPVQKAQPVQEAQTAPAPKKTVKPAGGFRCIFEIFDYDAARKEGICIRYLQGRCKSLNCYCTTGCPKAYGRASVSWKQGLSNCRHEHRLPKTKVSKKVSRAEQKYNERKAGGKKLRMTKRAKFDRQNKLSLEAARKRAAEKRAAEKRAAEKMACY